MAVDLDHSFATADDVEQTYAGIVDLERVIPLVEGGTVTEKTGPDSVKAEILVSMGAMSMTFKGTVEIVEKDEAAHSALMRVKSREEGGSGYANADITFALSDGEGTLHTHAQISGKAASMGEGVVAGVLDALITDFTGKLSTL
jgi:carbon monoxide dehydrogenase subunit G